jgi:hypothetical protein
MRKRRRNRPTDVKDTTPIDSQDIINEALKGLPTWTAPSDPDEIDWRLLHVVGIMRGPAHKFSDETILRWLRDAPGTSDHDDPEEPSA